MTCDLIVPNCVISLHTFNCCTCLSKQVCRQFLLCHWLSMCWWLITSELVQYCSQLHLMIGYCSVSWPHAVSSVLTVTCSYLMSSELALNFVAMLWVLKFVATCNGIQCWLPCSGRTQYLNTCHGSTSGVHSAHSWCQRRVMLSHISHICLEGDFVGQYL